jgi:hypothetical protein
MATEISIWKRITNESGTLTSGLLILQSVVCQTQKAAANEMTKQDWTNYH